MSPISAKVVSVYKESHQYRVVVQIEPEKIPRFFSYFKIRRNKTFTGACRNGRLDLFYYGDPGLKAGELFPLWTIQ
ncbi:MAG TPA: hypothetical protein VGF37_10005 [Chthoniobacterales bacterium]